MIIAIDFLSGLAMKNMRIKRKKGQYYIFTVITMLVIMLAVVKVFFNQIYDLIDPYENPYNNLVSEGNTIIDFMLSEGYPADWNNQTVKNIGLLTGETLDYNKLKLVSNMSYSRLKEFLGVKKDFVVFFESQEGEVSTIYDICGFGSPEINFTVVNRSIAYKNFSNFDYMNQSMQNLNATLYNKLDFEEFISSMNNYSVVFLDNPYLNDQNLTGNLTNYVSRGGIAFVYGGQSGMVMPFNVIIGGVNLTLLNLLAPGDDANFSVFTQDPFLDFYVKEQFNISGIFTLIISDRYSEDFLPISRYAGHSSSLSNQYIGNSSFARWKIGNGLIYATSGVAATSGTTFSNVTLINKTLDGQMDFSFEIAKGVARLSEGECSMNIPATNNLIKTVKFIRYDKVSIPKFKKIVVYTWA